MRDVGQYIVRKLFNGKPIRVIPNHFNKSLQVTLLELDETWYVSSACGFMKPDKITYPPYCMASL